MIYEEAVNYLNETAGFAKKTSLDNVKCLLGYLGEPQKGLHFIHVAGTNGKGSVCLFLEALLRGKGRTGVFTSPHILCVNERIRLDGADLDQRRFGQAFEKVHTAVQEALLNGAKHPSFFEFLFLMALTVFEEEQLDYCIIETGMGGLYDATNVLEPKLCILTSISMDHMEFLGNTLEEIAIQKAGIIQWEVPVICAVQKPEVTEVIQKKAKEKQAPLFLLSEDNLKFKEKQGKYIDFLNANAYDKRKAVVKNYMGMFQKENLALALSAIEALGITLCESEVYQALRDISLPGRMEEVMPRVFVDVAHNIQGMEAFAHTLRHHFPGKKRILFAASHKNEKDQMQEILKEIPEIEWFQTISVYGRKIPKKEFQDAFEQMIEKIDDSITCFVVGSFYLAGETKQYISRRK